MLSGDGAPEKNYPVEISSAALARPRQRAWRRGGAKGFSRRLSSCTARPLSSPDDDDAVEKVLQVCQKLL